MKENETSPDRSEIENEPSATKLLLVGFVVILLLWGMYWKWIAPQFSENQFDPLNALFSGLAFWGVICAILFQKAELVLQRRELTLTRAEVRGQKEQLHAQNITLKQQSFENTFFSLLNLFANLVNSIDVKPGLGAPPLKGRDCFTIFYNEFQRNYVAQQRNTRTRQ
jgi:hypothetical protein